MRLFGPFIRRGSPLSIPKSLKQSIATRSETMKIFGLRIMTEKMYQVALKEERIEAYRRATKEQIQSIRCIKIEDQNKGVTKSYQI